jgi:hypothetical protein
MINNYGSNTPVYGSGSALGLFDSYNPAYTDVLIKYTYYGDTNLDGKVDGTDYSRIDNGYSRDVFGFGMIVLSSLSRTPPTDHADIEKSVLDLDVPSDIKRIIERAVSLPPSTPSWLRHVRCFPCAIQKTPDHLFRL